MRCTSTATGRPDASPRLSSSHADPLVLGRGGGRLRGGGPRASRVARSREPAARRAAGGSWLQWPREAGWARAPSRGSRAGRGVTGTRVWLGVWPWGGRAPGAVGVRVPVLPASLLSGETETRRRAGRRVRRVPRPPAPRRFPCGAARGLGACPRLGPSSASPLSCLPQTSLSEDGVAGRSRFGLGVTARFRAAVSLSCLVRGWLPRVPTFPTACSSVPALSQGPSPEPAHSWCFPVPSHGPAASGARLPCVAFRTLPWPRRTGLREGRLPAPHRVGRCMFSVLLLCSRRQQTHAAPGRTF